MKQVVNVGIGGRSFVMDNDAYLKLGSYLDQFKGKVSMGGVQTKDVMDDLEERIAELFAEKLSTYKNVIDISLVNSVIAQLGMPDGKPFEEEAGNGSDSCSNCTYEQKGVRKFYRNPADKSLGGVCSGLSLYFGIDATLLRILFVVCFFMGLASFWVYIILWIVAPLAVTPAQKCEMYGLPVTAENISKFSNQR